MNVVHENVMCFNNYDRQYKMETNHRHSQAFTTPFAHKIGSHDTIYQGLDHESKAFKYLQAYFPKLSDRRSKLVYLLFTFSWI